MTYIPFDIIGQTYSSRSLRLSSQSTKGFYAEFTQDQGARELAAFIPLPGNKPFYTGLAANRGKDVFQDQIYVVNGSYLYRVDSAGTGTSIGAISGSGPVDMAHDATYLVVATGGTGYVYDGATLTAISDVDWNNARTVNYFNKRFVIDTPVGYGVTDLGDPFTVNALNTAEGESNPDAALGVFTFGQKIYPFGKQSIESWWNSGVGNPPFSREDFTFGLGVAGSYAVDTNSNFIYLLGSDRIPYKFSGLSKLAIGNAAIGKDWQSYADVSDCKVICCIWDNQHFVWFIFPSADRSWLYHEESGFWFQQTRGTGESRHCINGYLEAYGKKFITDYSNGNIYELDWDTFTDNGDIIVRERICAPLTAKKLGLSGKRVFVQGIDIHIEAAAPITGQGSSPTVMLFWSVDDGITWTEANVKAAVLGDYVANIRYESGMGYFDPHQNFLIKIRMTDPLPWKITGAEIDVIPGR